VHNALAESSDAHCGKYRNTMRLAFFHRLWIGVVLVFSGLITSTQGQSVNDKAQARLENLWENAAPSNVAAQNLPLPLWQLDLAQSSADSVNILVTDKQDNKSLFIGANEKGPGRFVELPALAIIPSYSLRLFTGSAGQIWIAGTHNYRDAPRTSFGTTRLSDAYLAEFDANGKVVWEHNFAGRSTETLHDLAVFPNGDVIVVGNSNDKQWLARISADAHVVWERTIGLRYAGAVALSGDKIVVAGFDAESEGVWRFTAAGEPLDKQIIEKENVERLGSVFMRLFVGASSDELYVFSAASGLRNANQSAQALPLKVAKLNQGQLVWRKEISQSTLQGLKSADPAPDHKSGSCFPPIFGLLASGDPLIACPTASGAVISRISSTTGELKQMTALWPPTSSCLRSWPKLLVPRPDRRIWLFGTGGCTWLDQISLAD
jgi:outer membrane protein assembly factor BamB